MQIKDAAGRKIDEVVVRLSSQELTDLLVAVSQMDDGSTDHGFVRDREGSALAIYTEGDEAEPLERATDWWVGPILLLAVVLLVIGAFTVARSIVELLF